MRPLPVSLVIVSVALAGCFDGENGGNGDGPGVTSAECLEQGLILGNGTDGNPICVEPPFVIEEFEDPDHYCVENQRRDRLHAPDLVGDPWRLGQSWTYSLEVDGETSETQLIYYADQDVGADLPLHYMVGTPTREEALEHALHSINPLVGRIHSVLYSPHESGDHADMFHFPLCAGSSWQTMFYGETFALTAQKESPDTDHRYIIEGVSVEGSSLRIDYDSGVQWFTFIDLDRADGGTVTMDLQEQGTGYTGDVFFLRGQKDAALDVVADAPLPLAATSVTEEPLPRQDGGAGPYDTVGFDVDASFFGYGTAELEIAAPDGTSRVYRYTLEGEEVTLQTMFEMGYQDGEWTVTLTMVSGSAEDPPKGEVHVQAVSIYDQSCTVGGDCLA